MALPWLLNPWREVRRLRKDMKWRDDMRLDMTKAWRDERIENYRHIREKRALKDENAELKRKVGELHKYCSHLEGKGSEPLCGCQGCVDLRPGLPGPGKPGWRYACEKCGNKRCPHHEWHGFKCTGSNEPDQIGEKE